MQFPRSLLAGLLALLAVVAPASAQDLNVLDSMPKAQAVIGEPGSSFFVRFDRPIDHIHSRLSIWQNGQLVERLTPRLESAPDVLFARAPTLQPGSYVLHWAVRTMTDVKTQEGDIPFSISGKR
ncbi:copper resistance protein CopC [Reyranella sp.]|uniref:copper resistance protein CopC n=1 Tax=Reyranella sp. TaxID=1929291 RepID=UPI003BA9DFB8